MPVIPKLHAQRPRDDLLKHRKAKDVVRQPKVGIIRAHRRQHVKSIASGEELERACAGNLLVILRDIFGIEQLDDCAS